MRHDWAADSLLWRHVAAFPLGGALAVACGLAFANLQPWARGLSFVGSLWLAIAMWLVAILAAYLAPRAGRIVVSYAVVTGLALVAVIGS